MATHVHCQIFIASWLQLHDCDIGDLMTRCNAKQSHCFRAKRLNFTVVSFIIIHFHLWQLNSHSTTEPKQHLRLCNVQKGVKIEHLALVFGYCQNGLNIYFFLLFLSPHINILSDFFFFFKSGCVVWCETFPNKKLIFWTFLIISCSAKTHQIN